jgi:hypothetical protein
MRTMVVQYTSEYFLQRYHHLTANGESTILEVLLRYFGPALSFFEIHTNPDNHSQNTELKTTVIGKILLKSQK